MRLLEHGRCRGRSAAPPLLPGALALGLALAGCSAGHHPGPSAEATSDDPVATSTPSTPPSSARPVTLPPAASTSGSAAPSDVPAEDVAVPERIRMPAVGIDAELVPLETGPKGVLQPPPYGVAGWWRAGPEPGERGRAVIAGHVDSQTGPDVFYRLSGARRGDVIRVRRADGSSVAFTVTAVDRVARDAFPTQRVYGATDRIQLRLVTCGGEYDEVAGTYEDNVIVYAEHH